MKVWLRSRVASAAGLRILDIAGIASGNLTEAAYFDIYPTSNAAGFNGAWNNYPFFASGNGRRWPSSR